MNTHSGRGTTAMEILLHKHLLVKFLTLISILGFLNQTLAFNKNPLSQIEDERSFAPQRTGEEAWSMVKKKGNQFVVNNHPFYFNGFNTYWLMIFGADESTKGNVTQLFQQASSVGLSVCRTWAFSDGKSPALQKSPSVYDEQIFKGLDFVVSEARKYKIRLILSFVNNWKDYGGKSQYVEWAKERGQQLTDEDAFYSNPVVKTYYKNHVKTVLTRVNTLTKVVYKDDPTIFAWELINEPRCPTDPSGNTFQSWIQEMASYVKSIDPNHLLEIGSEGYYGPSTDEKGSLNPNSYSTQVGTDFVRNHRTAGIDFASAHIYSDTWISTKISDAHITFYNSWMQAHISDAEKLGMPIVFAEFGLSSKDEGFTISFRDNIYKTAYNNQYESATKGGAAGGSMMWQLFPNDSVNMDDGYAIVLSKSPSTSNIISHQSRYLRLINSKA